MRKAFAAAEAFRFKYYEARSRNYNLSMKQAPQRGTGTVRHKNKVRTPARVLVGVVMGSKSDYEFLAPAIEILRTFGIAHEARIVSAHRTPDWLFQYAEQAESRGLRAIIAGAGGAAHLPGMLAAKTLVPVLGVPVPATVLNGIDSLLSIVQMPKGVPVGTLAIGKPGAANAALFAAEILASADPALREKLRAWRSERRDEVLAQDLAQ
ncbi:MAG: 5-(carboxyamino)imidazole ribonucleotide mutase [Acidobacteriaceae bacterium]